MRTLLYCQHSLGIGHLARTLLLAEALLEHGSVRLIAGGTLPPSLRIDPRIDVVSLPSLQMNVAGNLASADHANVEDRLRERALRAGDAAAEFAPDVVVIEMFPFGRKKFAAEILQILAQAREAGSTRRPRVFSSVRDILVTQRGDQAQYDARAARWANEHFDGVLVHSDPRLVCLDASFSAMGSLAIPTFYTGFVANLRARPPADAPANRCVVSAGGGRVGRALLQAAIDASGRLHAEHGMQTLVLCGTLGKKLDHGEKDERVLQLRTSVPDLAAVLRESAVSISQCGYNTMTDILWSGVPSVVVPFETPSEDEQLHRARILAERGRIRLIREHELTADSLAEAVGAISHARHACDINLNGAQTTATIIKQVVDDGRAKQRPRVARGTH